MTTRLRRLSTVILVATVFVSACSSTGETTGPTQAARGKALAIKMGCTTCHGTAAQGGLGPSWIGLSGSTVPLEDGSTVIADDAYLAESIRTPSAKKVAGYTLAMPPLQLSDDEVAALVAYINSLTAASTR